MNNMNSIKKKPTLEAIEPNFGHSYMYQKFDLMLADSNTKWYYHPEIELLHLNYRLAYIPRQFIGKTAVRKITSYQNKACKAVYERIVNKGAKNGQSELI